MNYHFVVLQDKADYFRISWSDIDKLTNVEYYDCFPCGGRKISKLLFKIHFSEKIRRYINLPFKSVWNKCFYTKKNEKPVCFIFSSRYAFLIYSGLIESLREHYPDSKFVCFYQDIVATHKDVRIADVKKNFDLVISYDLEDAKRFSIVYHPTVYSFYEVEDDTSIPYSDIYFVGAAKDRLGDIIEIYDKLTSVGCKCDFYITGCKEINRTYRPGINYISRLSYKDNLKHVKKTKAVLEILQHGAVGHSLRLWEAIFYNKYFITNGKISESMKMNNRGIISADAVDIKIMIDDVSMANKYSDDWKDLISVKGFLSFVEEQLVK